MDLIQAFNKECPLNFTRMKNVISLYFLVVLSGMIFFQSCQTKTNNWLVIGNTADSVQVAYLYQLNTLMQKSVIDSAQVVQGKFTFASSNPDDQPMGFLINFGETGNGGIKFLISNGDHLAINVEQELNSVFSGTSISNDFNTYNSFRQMSMEQANDLREALLKNDLNEEELYEVMLVFNEKTQELENEKIDFLKTIQNPELNSFLILNEIVSNGVIEKELFNKYMNALTAEGAMTNTGHKVHQIYDVFDAFAVSREMDILDSTTLLERYNQLDEMNQNSEFGKAIFYFIYK